MHTNDCLGGLEHIIKKIIKKNGKIYIGLYNKYGRKPFLDYFNKLKKNGCNNDILFQKYSELHSKLKDKTHLNSWFRDQIQHPHETQLSGSSNEQLISAILSSSVFATGSEIAALSNVNLIASVADFVLR